MATFWRGPVAAGPELSYRQPLALLQLPELEELLRRHGVSAEGCTTPDDFRLQALKHDLDGLDLSGVQAIEAKAREMLAVLSRLDRTIAFRPNAELGLMLKQSNEWAVVQATPPKFHTQVRVGDVLAAVDGEPVLLLDYQEMFAKVMEAKKSLVPYTLSFRRAPFHKGWMYKRSRGRTDAILGGLSGWKKRYFVLAYGVLAYYDDDRAAGGKHKGYYTLENTNNHQTMVTTAPAHLMAKGDTAPGLLLVKGDDKLVLKAASKPDDIHNWAALLYIAIAHANGGNVTLEAFERARQADAQAAPRAARAEVPPPAQSPVRDDDGAADDGAGAANYDGDEELASRLASASLRTSASIVI
ncbi:hypothetical protein M885DRAFT_625770 [Pelagophyceae sp. CCMP2097]|nr:hypothetical protein M885DRAFT_625770 [Pelagophyceae sp. CCMP2097]